MDNFLTNLKRFGELESSRILRPIILAVRYSSFAPWEQCQRGVRNKSVINPDIKILFQNVTHSFCVAENLPSICMLNISEDENTGNGWVLR